MEVRSGWKKRIKWGEVEPPDRPDGLDELSDSTWYGMWELIYRSQGEGFHPGRVVEFVD